jgi:hypothetical protein
MDLLKTLIKEFEDQSEKNSLLDTDQIYKLIKFDDEKQTEQQNRQGVIRRVPNAQLVYKRKTEDGTYEELWIYNINNIKTQKNVREAILAGTDIVPNQTTSEDNKQYAETWTSGNIELLKINGLPN